MADPSVVDSGEARDPGVAGALNTLREAIDPEHGLDIAKCDAALAVVETALADQRSAGFSSNSAYAALLREYQARAVAAEAERDSWKADAEYAVRQMQLWREACEEVQAERDTLRQALAFYADKETWDDDGRAWTRPTAVPGMEQDEDRGAIARAVLAGDQPT